MGWDQGTGRQDVQSFLLDLLEIDPNELLREALSAKMAEKGLSFEVVAETDRTESAGLYGDFTPDKILLSDGRVFVEALTDIERGDDWGNDCYSFVEAGQSFTRRRAEWHYDGNDPHVTEEVVPGDEPVPSSLEELRAGGNATAPGMGDQIVDFFAAQGITRVDFAPAEECGAGLCGACGDDGGPSSICDCPCHVEEGGVGC
jgi:hypothetical protein